MTTLHAQYIHQNAMPFVPADDSKTMSISQISVAAGRIDPQDPLIILSYLLVLVSVAVFVVSGQFPWFVAMLATGLAMRFLFPGKKSKSRYNEARSYNKLVKTVRAGV